MERKLSTKGIILDISSMRSRAKKLPSNDPEYLAILKVVTELDFYNEDIPIPTILQISKKAEVKQSKIPKLLRKIYEDLRTYKLQVLIPFELNEFEVHFSLHGFYGYSFVIANSITIIPREGERIILPYFKELTGNEDYYVNSVSHMIVDTKQIVKIDLRYGLSNSYWKLRRDQAIATREISFNDYLITTNDELKEKLDVNHIKPW